MRRLVVQGTFWRKRDEARCDRSGEGVLGRPKGALMPGPKRENPAASPHKPPYIPTAESPWGHALRPLPSDISTSPTPVQPPVLTRTAEHQSLRPCWHQPCFQRLLGDGMLRPAAKPHTFCFLRKGQMCVCPVMLFAQTDIRVTLEYFQKKTFCS